MLANMLVKVVAFAVSIMSVMYAAPAKTRKTPPVMIAAEKNGRTRADSR
jgi:hypothetical protein